MNSSHKLSPLLMRQIIISHYSNPTNVLKRFDKNNTGLIIKKNGNIIEYIIYKKSQTCVDEFHISLFIKNNIIHNIFFAGTACSISTAGLDILCDLLRDKNLKDAINIIDNYLLLVNGKKYDPEIAGEAICLVNTYKIPLRIKCATIGLEGITDILKRIKYNN